MTQDEAKPAFPPLVGRTEGSNPSTGANDFGELEDGGHCVECWGLPILIAIGLLIWWLA